MKTLDEVIKAFEICIGYYCSNAEHDVCPYLGESDMGCMKEPEKDALHYLKEYKEMKEHLACLDAATLHGEDTQRVNNPVLTWQELKGMEGKPVWVESEDGTGWGIIAEFYKDMFGNGKMTLHTSYAQRMHLNQKSIGVTWTAYKKERTDGTGTKYTGNPEKVQ